MSDTPPHPTDIIPEARAAREFVKLHNNGFVYTVGDGATAEVRTP